MIAFHTILIDAMNVLPEEFVLTCLYGEKANTIKDEVKIHVCCRQPTGEG